MTAVTAEDRISSRGGDRWGPILGGADRATVLAVVDSIAQDLETRPRGYSFGAGHDLALADGDAGIALLLAELPGYRDAAARRITRAIEGVGAPGMDASLHFGFTGIAWAWQRVMGIAGEPDDEDDEGDDPIAVVDQALLALLESPHARRLAPGVLFGLAGLAIYALDRRTPAADACLVAIVEVLRSNAEADGDGLRWWLPPPNGTAYVERFPDGFYDLGLDVGAAGIVAVCARIAARRVAESGACELVERATRWMFQHRAPAGLPSKVGRHGEAVHGFGWCKGELGIAIALLGVAAASGDAAGVDRAIELGRRAALVDPSSCDEPGFHIGAAGALHAFARLYHATGVPELRAAAIRWLERLLELRRPEGGIGGFYLASGETRQGLVQGAAGIGLALLAATSADPPAWDRVIAGPTWG